MNRNNDFLQTTFWETLQVEESENFSSLFQLLLADTYKVSFPFSFTLPTGNFFILIHTLDGCGKVLAEKECFTLSAGTLLLSDCREQLLRLEIATEPWKFRLFVISGGNFPSYFEFLSNKNGLLLSLTEYCQSALYIEQLLTSVDTSSTLYKLYQFKLINNILTDCIMAKEFEKEEKNNLPSYLIKIKQLFDENFQQKYSLDELAVQLNVNKFRLCREFNVAYGMSPIQYLNHHRIKIATQLLLTTDLKIHEIGSQVGIENTNHFISLFRKMQGTTPLEYRQQMTTLKYNGKGDSY